MNESKSVELFSYHNAEDELDTKPKIVINVIISMMLRIEKSLPVVVKKLKEVTSLSDEKLMIEKIDKKINTSISKMESRITRKTS